MFPEVCYSVEGVGLDGFSVPCVQDAPVPVDSCRIDSRVVRCGYCLGNSFRRDVVNVVFVGVRCDDFLSDRAER